MNSARTSLNLKRRGLSLEWKLPLGASAVLAVLLVGYTWIAYREVATSAVVAASQRDSIVATELARLTGASSLVRARLVSAVVNRDSVHAALNGTAPIETIDSA